MCTILPDYSVEPSSYETVGTHITAAMHAVFEQFNVIFGIEYACQV